MPVTIQPSSYLILAQGFMLCASLIMAIGPQNLFLLRQGLRRRHLFVTASLCTLVDLLLISLGVGGLGTAIASNEHLLFATTLGGVAFLLGYGVRSFRAAWNGQSTLPYSANQNSTLNLKNTVLTTLCFSILNPAAYIDTLLMIGTTSGRYPLDERIFFAAGALLASGLWFFTLTYGASRLTPLFRRPLAWRTLDAMSGCIMFGLAALLSITQ